MALQPIRPLELMKDSSMTKSEFSDFIGIWQSFVPASLCEEVINHFDDLMMNTPIIERQHDEKFMDGTQQFLDIGKMGRSDQSILLNQTNPVLGSHISQYLQAASIHYVDEYPQLKCNKLISTDLKTQKTSPNGGYHVWHYENSSYEYSNRELTWILYLNTMPENEAETEFMFQKKRVRPTQGTMVIWPAGMTHVHRGLTVYSQDKYIITGWYLKIP